MHHRRNWIVLAALTFCVGCNSRPTTLAVQGNVSYQGKDVAWGKIDFIPIENTAGASACSPIADGRYEIPEKWGLLPDGVYEVHISAFREARSKTSSTPEMGRPTGEVAPNYIPAAYNSQSTLKVHVADLRDKNKLDFHLPANHP
jgi:hypothetical protein